MGGSKLEKHIGENHNYLTIVGIDRERMNKTKGADSYVFADCDCGELNKSYNYNKIKRGETKSCGHLKIKHDKPNKINEIILFDSYGEIIVKGISVLFDKEDYHFLKNKWWYIDDYGYLTHCYCSKKKNYYIRFHRLIMFVNDNDFVDHINRNTYDCRKENLRICTKQQNNINKNPTRKNTSGVIGVGFYKERNKWVSTLTFNKKTINLGRFDLFEEAITARLKAEKEYFGEYSPQKHLFKQYGIGDIDD